MSDATNLTVGSITLDPAKRKLISGRGRVDLGADACRVAERLMREPGVTVPTAELLAAMATSGEGGPAARLQDCIGRIGLALTMLAGARPRIRSEVGGYVFEAMR